MKKPIELEPIQGHIVLYCKGQYRRGNEINFFEGLKMIWAIRCGYDYKQSDSSSLSYIANDMYKIIVECLPHKLEHLMETLHREIGGNSWMKPKDLTPIQSIIWEYRAILSNMQIREKPEGYKRYQWIVKLPKTKHRIFNRILSGKGEYDDYKLITK